jgi:hypothetical protein
MNFFRIALTVFSILNVAFWGGLAWAWAVRPAWAARLPFKLGTEVRSKSSVLTWARLAAAIAGFWAVMAALYLTVWTPNRVAVVALFVAAAAFLILALGAAARIYQVLQKGKVPAIIERHQRAV